VAADNVACAEQAFTLMLTLARKLHRLAGRISVEQLAEIGYVCKPFDRRHVPNANWGRIGGMRSLKEVTLGLIGLGEIGAEIAIRARAFGMHILYHQPARLPAAEEDALGVTCVPLDDLLAASDWIVLQLGSVGRAQLARMKPGAFLINIAHADLVERAALIEALRSGMLGGFGLAPLDEPSPHCDDELLGFDNVVIAAPPRQEPAT
jgi:lactate dehydrogenase-like 2-hydroxyacid dehydrogenase